MATRSAAIVIANDTVSDYYYRHWDGYPSAAGAALLRLAETLEWNPDPIIQTLEGKGEEVENDLKSNDTLSLVVGLPKTNYEPAGNMPLTDLDYFYVIDCDQKHIRCHENMFKHDPHDFHDLPPYKILKWI
ncbi:hypothetical protein HDR70_05165 [bacterium]|nr:hypothetical protein [bacterium]